MKRNYSFDLLRIVAALGVIGLHIAGEDVFDAQYGSLNSWALNMYHCIGRFAVPCFFMITGCLYLSEKRNLELNKKYILNIIRFIVLYVLYSIGYAAMATIFDGGIDKNFIPSVLLHAMTSPKYHLWYLPSYVGVLLSFIIVKKFLEGCNYNKRIIQYILILYLVTVILRSIAIVCPENFVLIEFLQRFNADIFLNWTGVALLGLYINDYMSDKNYKFLVILGIISIIIASQFSYYGYGRIETAFYDKQSFQVLMFAASIFIIVVKYIKINNDNIKKIINNIAPLTLGIYLIHPVLLNLLTAIGFKTYNYNAMLVVLLVEIGTFIIIGLIVKVLSVIPVVKKLV